MAIIGESLTSSLKKRTANTSFDSFSSDIPERSGSGFGANLADFVGNTLYGVIDSAAFGIPTLLAENDKVEEYRGLGKRKKVKYNNFLDDFGIQPLEAEDAWGRAGRGVGEAIGFFIPFSGVSKGIRAITSPVFRNTARGASTSISRAVREGVGSTTSLKDSIKLISKSIDDGAASSMSKGVFSNNTTNGVEAVVKGFIKKTDNVTPIMKSTIDDIEKLGFRMEQGIAETSAKYLKETNKFSNSQIRKISQELGKNVSDNLMKAGKNNRFIDDIDGYVTDIVTRTAGKAGFDGKAARVMSGYIGRSVSTTLDFYAFDQISKLSREMVSGESEINIPKDLKESAEFSFLVSAVDMIGINKRASSIKDIIRLAKMGTSSKRSWAKMLESGTVNRDQLRQAVIYFSSMGKKTPFGKSSRDIMIGSVSDKKLAAWLDKTYATNKEQLKSLISDDAKRGILSALPRAGVDAVATAMYFSSKDDRSVFSMFDDEYVVGDFVMGALMALRNPGSLDRDSRIRFRTNDEISKKFSLLEKMGSDIKPLKEMLNYQSELYKDVYSSVVVKEDLDEYQEIIKAFETPSKEEPGDPIAVDQLSSEQSNMLVELYNNFFLQQKILDLGITDISDLTELRRNGILTNINQLSSKQFKDLWSRIKNIETSQGKKIEDYENFDTLYEDILQSSVKNQKEHIVSSLSRFGDAFGLTKIDYSLRADRGSTQEPIEMYMPDKEGMDLTKDESDAFDFMVNLMNSAEKAGLVKVIGRSDDAERKKPQNVDSAKENLLDIVDDYSAVVEKLDPNFQHSSGDNPAINLLSEYNSFVKKNDLMLALEGKKRDTNRELLNLIEYTLGTDVNSTGEVEIDLDGVDKDSIDKDELDRAKRVLEAFTGLRIISGKSNSSTKPMKIHYDKAMNFVEKMESDTGFGMVDADGPIIRIANSDLSSFQREVGRKIFERSDLNVNDYIAINRLSDGLSAQVNSEGKMVLPSSAKMKDLLLNEFGEEGANTFLGKYNDLLNKLRPTGKISEVDNYTIVDRKKVDIASTIESAFNISNNVYFSDLNSLKESLESKEYKEKLKEYEKIVKEASENPTLNTLNKARAKAKEIAGYGFDFNLSEKIFKEIDSAIASENFSRITPDLFNNHITSLKEYYGEIDRLFKEVRKITSNNDTFGAASSQGFFIRTKILEYLGKNIEGSQKTLSELVFDYFDSGGSHKELTDLINHSNRLYANRIPEGAIREQDEIAAKEVSELKEKFESMDHDHSKQKFVTLMKRKGIQNVLSSDGKDISIIIKEKLLSTDQKKVDSAIEQLLEAKEKAEGSKYSEDDATLDVLSVIKSTLGNKEKRKSFSVVMSGDTAVMRYEKDEKSAVTPLTVFTNSRRGFAILKDEYVTSNSKKSSIIGDWKKVRQKLLFGIEAEKNEYEGSPVKKGSSESMSARFEIIPVQGNEEFAITFQPSKDNMNDLVREIDDWYNEMESYLQNNHPDKLDLFRRHFQDKYNNYRNIENVKDRESMIRALYYDSISRDYFINTLGDKFDVNNIRSRQAKMYKYSHVPNNKNGLIVDKVLADVMASVYEKNSSSSMKEKGKLIRERKKNGLNIAVFRDEYDADELGVSMTSAEASVRNLIKEAALQRGVSEDIANELVETTLSNLKNSDDFSERKMESIEQAITDGAVFASKEAMQTDMAIFGGNFEDGQTSYKGVIYNRANSDGNIGRSVIGKQNIFYDPEIAKIIPEGVDYLMPTSAAKVWGGSVAEMKSFNMNSSLKDNLSNISLSPENFSIDTINYLFPSHKVGKGRSNPSVTHFWNREALRDYSKKLDIENIVAQIGDVLNARHNTSGMKAMLIERFEEIGSQYDSYSGLERLIMLGDSVDNTFVRDQVIRIFKSMTLDKTLKQTSNNIVNSFLRGDHNLASPIYDKRNGDYSNQYVKKFGELSLPSNAGNAKLSDINSTIIFERNVDGDFQDYVVGADGSVFDPTTIELDDVSDSVKPSAKAVSDIFSLLKDSNLRSAKYLLDRVNNLLKNPSIDDADKAVDIAIKSGLGDSVNLAKAILSLRKKGIRNLSIGVNTQKIPKKYISDSVVNRLAGFLSKEEGNVVKVNNYEIAVNHQADQDGDKIWVYTDMPTSVLRVSANNMSLGKDFAQTGTNTPDPNFYNSISDKGVGERDGQGSIIDHMRRIKQSRNVIGQVVKIQGATTMLSAANLKINGQSVLNVNSREAINFNNRLIAVLQNALDPHNGIADELLSPNKLKDFLLFGDPLSDKITKTPNEIGDFNGFMDVRSIAESLGLDFDKNGDDVLILKDMLREVFDAHSMVYSASSDVYEGGVGRTPNIDEYADIWLDFKRFKQNPTEYIFESLAKKYSFGDRGKTDENFTKLKKMREILTKDTEGKKKYRETFRELFSMEDISNDYPQMLFVKSIVNNRLDTDNLRESIKVNPMLDEILNIERSSVVERLMTSSSENKKLLLSQILPEQYDELFNSNFEEEFKNSKNSIRLAEKVGNHIYVFNKKIDKLQSKLSFYESRGYDTSHIEGEIANLIEKRDALDKKLYDAGTNYFKDNEQKFRKDLSVKNGYFKNNGDKRIHIYKKVGESIKFVDSIAPKEGKRLYNSDNYIALYNPLKIEPIDKVEFKEGLAMELATDSNRVASTLTMLSNDYNIDAEKFYDNILRNVMNAKIALRDSRSKAINQNMEAKQLSDDIWSRQTYERDIILNEMYKGIADYLSNFDLSNQNHADALYVAASIMMKPNIVQNSVIRDGNVPIPYYKNEKNWIKSIFSSDTFTDNGLIVQKHLEEIYTSFGRRLMEVENGTGAQESDTFQDLNADNRWKKFQENSRLARSTFMYSSLNPRLRNVAGALSVRETITKDMRDAIKTVEDMDKSNCVY